VRALRAHQTQITPGCCVGPCIPALLVSSVAKFSVARRKLHTRDLVSSPCPRAPALIHEPTLPPGRGAHRCATAPARGGPPARQLRGARGAAEQPAAERRHSGPAARRNRALASLPAVPHRRRLAGGSSVHVQHGRGHCARVTAAARRHRFRRRGCWLQRTRRQRCDVGRHAAGRLRAGHAAVAVYGRAAGPGREDVAGQRPEASDAGCPSVRLH